MNNWSVKRAFKTGKALVKKGDLIICLWVGLALEVFHDALTSKLCVMGNAPVVPPPIKVPEEGILDQICKMGTTNQQDQTALAQSSKGLCTNLLSCKPWLWMLASGWPLEQGRGRWGGQPKPSGKSSGTTWGWQVLKYDSSSKKNNTSGTVIARKLVIASQCDTIIVSIAPKEEGNDELLLPWRFLVAARGC